MLKLLKKGVFWAGVATGVVVAFVGSYAYTEYQKKQLISGGSK